jgi:hypothetical protein
MRVHLLAVQLFAFVFEDRHRPELIRVDVIEVESNTHLQRRPEIERAPQQQARLGRLCRVEFV